MYDCIVVGAGVEGSASAYHLAKMGKKTLLLEQFPLPHTRGSSHGASRITRKSYEQDVFVEMMIEAYELWNTLEKESNETLFIPEIFKSFTVYPCDDIDLLLYAPEVSHAYQYCICPPGIEQLLIMQPQRWCLKVKTEGVQPQKRILKSMHGFSAYLDFSFKALNPGLFSNGTCNLRYNAYQFQYQLAPIFPVRYNCSLEFTAFKQTLQNVSTPVMPYYSISSNTGLLTIEDASTGVVQKCTEGLKKLNLPYESLSGHDIYKRFPTIEVPSTWIGVYDPDAGVLLADKCLAAYHSQFKANGGEIHDTEPMLEVIPSSTTVLVKTTKANYVAKSVVLCLGPWAKPALLKLSLDLPLRVAQITVCYWKCDDLEEYSAGGGFPCIFLNNELGHCYGLPAVEYPGLFKFCRHEGPLIDPNQRDAVQDELSIKIPAEYIKKHFKRMSPKPAIVEKCMYTWTPDKAFILDTHPQYKNVVFGAGFSGHGFKLSPVVGKVLAALAIGNIPEKYDMTLFKANRFNMAKL